MDNAAILSFRSGETVSKLSRASRRCAADSRGDDDALARTGEVDHLGLWLVLRKWTRMHANQRQRTKLFVTWARTLLSLSSRFPRLLASIRIHWWLALLDHFQ
jgi:hypothetical protein